MPNFVVHSIYFACGILIVFFISSFHGMYFAFWSEICLSRQGQPLSLLVTQWMASDQSLAKETHRYFPLVPPSFRMKQAIVNAVQLHKGFSTTLPLDIIKET